MARNLSRNTKLYVSTQTLANIGSCDNTNTWEVKVLDGYSFSQDVASQEVGVSESASECSGQGQLSRATRSFNTALNPVDVSFSTYVRPYDNGTNGYAVELPLWGAALSGSANFANVWTETTSGVDIVSTYSDVNELQLLTLYFVLDSTTYVIENVSLGTAEVDFSIDGIATINWTASGTTVSENQTVHATIATWTVDADYKGIPTGANAPPFLRNKLSTLVIRDNEIYGVDRTSPDETDTMDADGSAGVVSLTGTIAASPAYVGGKIYNSTRNQWATIKSHDTADVTVTPNDASRINADWKSGDAVTIFATSGESDAIASVNTTTGVITGTDISISYAGGRAFNVVDGQWITILSNTTGAGATITPIAADIAVAAAWSVADTLILYTSAQHSGVEYCIPITGGTLTLENNMTYLTPEELAIVNEPLAGFTGNRAISGSVTAYLNTGAQGSAGLLSDLLDKITEVSNNFRLELHMGGSTSTTPRVDFIIPHAQISIPTINVEDVISTEISFFAQSWDNANNEPDFESANEIYINYRPTMA